MKYLIPFLFFFAQSGFSQTGCTDPLAENFDENALENDGSCLYKFTVDRPHQLFEMDDPILESSGLIYTNDGLWTHNDSGNDPILYLLDTLSFEIKRQVVIGNVENEDWEELASDGVYFYIGDFGNNKGDRKDLKVLRVLRSDVQEKDTVTAEIINFYYPDQLDFDLGNKNHNFDCEAFFVKGDSLHLFTKNWDNRKTKHYTLPRFPGDYSAIFCDSFDVDGLITAADIAPDGVISLLGYEDKATGEAFQWLLFDYENMNVFSGNKRKLSLGSIIERGQVEGLAFSQNGEGYISSEAVSFIKPKMVRFTTLEWTDEITATEIVPVPFQFLVMFPNPVNDSFNIVLNDCNPGDQVNIEILNAFGQILLSKEFIFNSSFEYRSSIKVDASNLSKGSYFVKIEMGGFVTMKVFLKI